MTVFYYVMMTSFPHPRHEINKVELDVISEDNKFFYCKQEDGTLLPQRKDCYFNTLEEAKTYIISTYKEKLEEELSDIEHHKENVARIDMNLIEIQQITEADIN